MQPCTAHPFPGGAVRIRYSGNFPWGSSPRNRIQHMGGGPSVHRHAPDPARIPASASELGKDKRMAWAGHFRQDIPDDESPLRIGRSHPGYRPRRNSSMAHARSFDFRRNPRQNRIPFHDSVLRTHPPSPEMVPQMILARNAEQLSIHLACTCLNIQNKCQLNRG